MNKCFDNAISILWREIKISCGRRKKSSCYVQNCWVGWVKMIITMMQLVQQSMLMIQPPVILHLYSCTTRYRGPSCRGVAPRSTIDNPQLVPVLDIVVTVIIMLSAPTLFILQSLREAPAPKWIPAVISPNSIYLYV